VLQNFKPKPKKASLQTTELQRVCAWCGRVHEDDRWVHKRQQAAHLITHGICPDCYATVMSKLDPRD
jgi:hypothetical protein